MSLCYILCLLIQKVRPCIYIGPILISLQSGPELAKPEGPAPLERGVQGEVGQLDQDGGGMLDPAERRGEPKEGDSDEGGGEDGPQL